MTKREKLKKLSPHWFRHQSASMQARLGIPTTHIKANLRYESQQTTMIYVHADEDERIQTMNLLSWQLV
jgi:site-specific recombinase XerD